MRLLEAVILVLYYAFPILAAAAAAVVVSPSSGWRSRIVAVAAVLWSMTWLARSAITSSSRADVPMAQWAAVTIGLAVINVVALASLAMALANPTAASEGQGVWRLARRRTSAALLVAVAVGYVAAFFLLPTWE